GRPQARAAHGCPGDPDVAWSGRWPRLSGTALSLVLAAALLHATWNLAAKGVGSSRIAFIWLYVVASAAIWVPLGVLWVLVTGERAPRSWLPPLAVSAGRR